MTTIAKLTFQQWHKQLLIEAEEYGELTESIKQTSIEAWEEYYNNDMTSKEAINKDINYWTKR